jgi:LPXTG-site transpeptidase (sortase) family protein
VVTALGSGSNPSSAGRQAVFNFQDLNNSSGTVGTITIQYRAVVLDVIENQGDPAGPSHMNNAATLSWASGSLPSSSSTQLTVVEPKLALTKTADITVATPGTRITFLLTVSHDPTTSTADAYDVVLVDTLPAGLTYVPGSLGLASGGGSPADIYDDTNPLSLSVTWNTFGVADVSVITFQADLGPLGPGASVTNSANVQWTSLPGIPPNPYPAPQPVLLPGVQSQYNDTSHERRYDPLRAVDIYGVSSSVTVSVPVLPKTGFAPGELTSLPAQPAESRYLAMGNLWLEIPTLGVRVAIVGVPASGTGWDLTWLGSQAGYLAGTAYPTWSGNSALTGHVYLADGQPGPFVNLRTLSWGQQVIVHMDGLKYIYKVQDVRRVWPDDLSVLAHADVPTLTLITCQDYNQAKNEYEYRIAVRAVLVATETDGTAGPVSQSGGTPGVKNR